MASYVIAVQSELRHQVEREWAESLATIEGLQVVGSANPYRLRVEATHTAIELAREKLGRYCHIEEIQPRYVPGG